jgi:hypothetical protein
MTKIKAAAEGVNFFNVLEKVKAVALAADAVDAEKLNATQASTVSELAGSEVVADISAKVDEIIAALKTAGVIASV